MVSTDDAGYEWLSHTADGPGPWLINGCCFTFLEGLDAAKVAERAGIAPLQPVDLSSAADPFEGIDNDAAVFDQDGWTVVYQDNGYPQQVANTLAGALDVSRAVIVYWNVNGVVELSYWESGELVGGFSDFVSDPIGPHPERLQPEFEAIGLVENSTDVYAHEKYPRMLKFAERVTGIVLPEYFLRHPRVFVGRV